MHRRDFLHDGTILLAGLALSRGARRDLFPQHNVDTPPKVNGQRLNATLAQLSRYGSNPQGGVSRVAYSDADREGRLYIRSLMENAGLEVRLDAAGNLFGKSSGRRATEPSILFGSHADSVPEGGNFDGDVGTMSAIEVMRTLGEQRIVTDHPLEAVCWQNEEGLLFGSRAFAGLAKSSDLDLGSTSGKTIRDGTAFIGGDPSHIDSAKRAPGTVACYLELHIEQGGTLERDHVDIGVVEGIVGIWEWTVTVTGFANHAGTTPMDQRKDALLSAARFIEMVHRVVRAERGRQVGNVGQIRAEPGAPNVIPGKVVMSLELRDLESATVDRMYARITDEARAIGAADGTSFAFTPISASQPARCDPRLQQVITTSARELGLSSRPMPSGAGHDAQEVARVAPVGMIFVPSVGGISHSPKEFTKPEDVERGANVLLRSVLAADRLFESAPT